MNVFSRAAIATAAVLATAIIPATGATAAIGSTPEYGKQYNHKKPYGHYKKGPRTHYPRAYHKHRSPVVVHKSGSNAAPGTMGFSAGAIAGGMPAGGR